MSILQLTDEEFLKRLNAYPEIRERMETILLAVEDESEGLTLADDAEQRMIEEMRHLGQESLQAWARRKTRTLSDQIEEQEGVWKDGKKNSAGIRHLETSV